MSILNGKHAESVALRTPVRIVLVGRTGLDQLLRTRRECTLARARTLTDALGELADMHEPGNAVGPRVVIGPGVLNDSSAREFADACRDIEPGTRLMIIIDDASAANAEGTKYAGVADTIVPWGKAVQHTLIAGSPLADSIVRTLFFEQQVCESDSPSAEASDSVLASRSPAQTHVDQAPDRPNPTPAATVHQAAIVEEPAEQPAPERIAPERPPEPIVEVDSVDAAPLRALLRGQGGVAAALESISQRLGAIASFVPGAPASITDAASGARVVHAGRTLGLLKAPGIDRSRLQLEAQRLALWAALEVQHEQLRQAAFTDELTGAWNRRYFKRFLQAAIQQARATRLGVSLLLFDLDNFKTYNDRFGHAAGDEILSETVRLLKSVIRPSDRVCRIGGDEFAVIFHDPDGPRSPQGATSSSANTSTSSPSTQPPSQPSAFAANTPRSIATIAARFQRQICEHRFPKLLDEAKGTLTISGGMATFPWDGTTPDELVQRADELSMQSKRQGKNLITYGPGAMRVCGIDHDAPLTELPGDLPGNPAEHSLRNPGTGPHSPASPT